MKKSDKVADIIIAVLHHTRIIHGGIEEMSELREQQMEALQVAGEYSNKLIVAMNKIIEELSGNRLPDTDEYMDSILKGLNWLFEVFNGTKDIINEKEVVIDKDVVNVSVNLLNEGINEKDDEKKAEALKGILQFVEVFHAQAEKLTAN